MTIHKTEAPSLIIILSPLRMNSYSPSCLTNGNATPPPPFGAFKARPMPPVSAQIRTGKIGGELRKKLYHDDMAANLRWDFISLIYNHGLWSYTSFCHHRSDVRVCYGKKIPLLLSGNVICCLFCCTVWDVLYYIYFWYSFLLD